MPQSLVKNYIHITFSTKGRIPMISKEIEVELWSYLGGICKNQECYPVEIGGYRDHVHILCILSRKIALMKLIEELKSYSSGWIKTKGQHFQQFYWQSGYGGFSVSPSKLEVVRKYIKNQEEHHKRITFKEEYITFLKNYNLDYNEKYIWD